jgi:hypothetical protein
MITPSCPPEQQDADRTASALEALDLRRDRADEMQAPVDGGA